MKKKNEDIVDAIVKKQSFNLTFKESNKAAKRGLSREHGKTKRIEMYKNNDFNNGNVTTQRKVENGAAITDSFLSVNDAKVQDAEPTSPTFGLPIESPSAPKEKESNQSPSAQELSPTRESELKIENDNASNLQFEASEAAQEYITAATQKGGQPLPILDRISP